MQRECGTFLLRFSESKIGALVISFTQPSVSVSRLSRVPRCLVTFFSLKACLLPAGQARTCDFHFPEQADPRVLLQGNGFFRCGGHPARAHPVRSTCASCYNNSR
ncbi:unnamed protein product [Ectocarpus sp. 12 AP-2014]